MAKQLFPHESALGKVIVEDNDEPMQITGVFADRAKNTEIDFDLIKSYSSLDAHFQRLTGRETDFSHTSWDWPRIKIFLSLRDVQAEENLNSKLENYLSKQKPRSENEGITEILHLQKIEDIHMNSPLGKPFGTKTEKARQTGFMELIVWVILLIAWINFVNLSTVKALEKAKDAGIKKILGASRGQLMIQFLLESLLVNMMALFVALTIFQTILPLFNQWLGIEGNYVFLNTGYWLGGMILVVVSGALAAGYYPAFLLAASKAQDALTYHGRTARSRFPLRKGLIVAQFTITTILVSGTIGVFMQLDYMRSQPLGMEIEQTLVIEGPRAFDYERFSADPSVIKHQLEQIPGVEWVSSSYSVPGKGMSVYDIHRVDQPDKECHCLSHEVDHQFVEAYGLHILAGRNFSPQIAS
ncbi:MAG: hypothetical protein KDD63_27590, partial [Bacteroidetes bacterium]|nr:hypothetical protein [Bacteroidota bacterium]